MSIINEQTYLLPVSNNNRIESNESIYHSNRIYYYISIVIISIFLFITIEYRHYFSISNSYNNKINDYIRSCNEIYGYNDFHCITNSTISQLSNTYRIILYGDSLIQKPNIMYNLSSNILNQLNIFYPKLSFEIIVSAKNGNKINDLKNKLYIDCLYYQPHSVIMYWDSDISIEDIEYMNSNITIQNYIKDLNDVLYISKKIITNIAIAGPCLLGEKPHGENKYDIYIDKYRDINRNIANNYNTTYIDIRKEYFNNINRNINQSLLNNHRITYKKGSRGYINNLTIDGEHPSLYGSIIEEQLFVNQLIIWYKDV